MNNSSYSSGHRRDQHLHNSRPKGLLTFLLICSSTVAFAQELEIQKPDVDSGINVPLPTAGEESTLRQQRDAEISVGAARLPSHESQFSLGIDGLRLNSDDALMIQAAQIESPELIDSIQGGPTGFEKDTRWGAEGVSADRFAGANDGNYRSVAGARLSDGSTVLVSVVEYPGFPRQLGITRRNGKGQRIAWPNASASYGGFGNQYLLWPNNNGSPPPAVFDVHDVALHDSKIYALVTANIDGKYLPVLVVFRENGSFAGWWFASFGDQITQDGVALDISGNSVIVLARNSLAAAGGGFWTWRATLDANGAPQDGLYTDFPTPYNNNNRSGPVDIEFRSSVLLFPPQSNPSYYVLANYKFSADNNSDDHDPLLVAINHDGTIDTSFGTAGGLTRPFDMVTGGRDMAIGLDVRGVLQIGPPTTNVEEIYAVVSVQRSERNGTGVFKLRSRTADNTFGNLSTGRAIFGGCGGSPIGEGCVSTGPIFTFPAKHNHPTDIAVSGSSVAVSGYQDGGTSGTLGSGIYPTLAVLNTSSGNLEHLSSHSPGTGLGQGRFLHVVAHNADDFVAGGWAYSSVAPNDQTMISTRLIRVGNLIFRNGFECVAGRPGCP